MGARRRDYETVAPHNSFIHVDDFAGPRQLADYLHLLASNDTLYGEYFSWRERTWSLVNLQYWCRLCALLHWRDDVNYVSWYDDYETWWNGACQRDADAPWFQRNWRMGAFFFWVGGTYTYNTADFINDWVSCGFQQNTVSAASEKCFGKVCVLNRLRCTCARAAHTHTHTHTLLWLLCWSLSVDLYSRI